MGNSANEIESKVELPDERIKIAQLTRDERIAEGADQTVAGWQCFLEVMLIRIEAYLHPGHLIPLVFLFISIPGLKPPCCFVEHQIVRYPSFPILVQTILKNDFAAIELNRFWFAQ